MLPKLADVILRFRFLVLVALAAATVWFGLGARQLRFDYSPQAMLETGDDDDAYLHAINAEFGSGDRLVMLIVERDGGVLDHGTLEYVDELTRVFDAEAFTERARGLTTLELAIPPKTDEDDLTVEPLGLDVTEARIAGDPLVDGLFVNGDRTATLVMVELLEAYHRVEELRPLVERIAALLAAHPPPDGVTVTPYGIPQLRVEAVRLLRQDQVAMLPLLAVIFFLVLFGLVGGRLIGAVAPMAAMAVTLVWVGGLMGYTGQPVNILSNVLPILLFAIGISDAIHLLARYMEEGDRGVPGGAALRTTIVRLTTACFLTSFTTAVGFGSLVVSRTRILANFGWVSALGVMFAYVITILLVPVLLSFARPLLRRRSRGRERPPSPALLWLSRTVVDHSGRWLLGAAALVAVALVGAFFVRVDNRVHGAFRPESDLYESQMAAERAAGGMLPLVVSVRSEEPWGLRDPAVLRRVWALQKYIEAQEGTGPTSSPATLVRALWVAFQGLAPPGEDPIEDPNLPRTSEELAQILLLGSLGGGMPFERVVDEEWTHLRIVTRLEDLGSRRLKPMFERVRGEAESLLGGMPGISVRLTGEAYVASAALHYFIYDLLNSLALAAVIIFTAMSLLFRSIKEGLISIVPNVLPLVCTFGYMGFARIPLNATTVVTFAISLGIAVDDTIHFLTRFNEEHLRVPAKEAVRLTVLHAGRPIVMTTVLLATGLLVLTGSQFLATQRFATLVIIAIVSALPGDLVVLPALLARFGGRRRPSLAAAEPPLPRATAG